jgi:hypothetical protein
LESDGGDQTMSVYGLTVEVHSIGEVGAMRFDDRLGESELSM